MMRTVTKTIAIAAMTASLAASLLGAAPPEPQPQRPNAVPSAPMTREGWWIRVNPGNQADNVSWRFGAARNRLSNPLRWWKDEQPIEFDLPAAQRGVKVLYLAAIGLPYKAPVSFCVFFQNHGAALVEFAGEHAAPVNQDQQEPACVP